jgi:hypothetical protein
VLDFSIGSRPYLQVPKPLLYLPPLSSTPDIIGTGNTTITIATNNQSVIRTDAPLVTQQSGRDRMFVIEPPQLIEPEQNFSITISYPSGLVPVIATGVTDDTSNALYIGVHLDGVLLRPLQ